MPDNRIITCAEAILEAQDQAMANDPNVYVMGLGVPDPKGVFGTTKGLQEKYGSKRVMDMPTSENGMTGIAVGSAIMGMRPVMTHQRVDFALLALDQIINNAAKWHYMFAGKMTVPLVIRLIIGRGWGQGPQHSQSLFSLFGHIPGLTVVAPTTAYDAKGLLISAIKSNNPIIYLEHRWLHNTCSHVPQEPYEVPLGKAKVVKSGQDLTIVAISHMTIEALKAAKELEKEGIDAEVIDLRSIKPIDEKAILTSVKKTGRLMVCEQDWKTMSVSSEIITLVVEKEFNVLKTPPIRVTLPDCPSPTNWVLTNHYYPTFEEIIYRAKELMGLKQQKTLSSILENSAKKPQDVPDKSFTGPF